MIRRSSNDEATDSFLERETPIEVLLRLTATAGILRSKDGRSYAQVKAGGRQEILGFRQIVRVPIDPDQLAGRAEPMQNG